LAAAPQTTELRAGEQRLGGSRKCGAEVLAGLERARECRDRFWSSQARVLARPMRASSAKSCHPT
jgi:hypothetical protein